ncbi:MAG: DUF934 domain-containing protein [Alphaproteobacteria bacterium]
MPLIRNGQFTKETWLQLGDDAALPGTGDIIVSLERWRAEREALLARSGRLGIRLRPDQPPRLIADDLGHFALVALEFPAFKDGRAYSHARVLRQRYGFAGEVRAAGEVLRDQLLFMVRCGFDAFEVAEDLTREDWRAALAEFSVFYQRAADGREPAWALRHARAAVAE